VEGWLAKNVAGRLTVAGGKMTHKRLAITLSGGGSLGAYEAGAISEIIEGLRYHNTKAEDDDRIELDVFTGSSAGSINSVLVVEKLLYEGDSLSDPGDNPLYDFWVRKAKMQDGLLRGHGKVAYSVCDSEYFREIISEQVVGTPKTVPHPVAAGSISIGLALANMTGLDYRRVIGLDQQYFIYTRYEDEYVRLNITADNYDQNFWSDMCNAAVASGAFPFMLACQELIRKKWEYDWKHLHASESIDWPSEDDEEPVPFAYIDGGAFHNQPLGIARILADKIDKDISEEDPGKSQRYYLFISPWDKRSSIGGGFNASDATYLPLAAQLLYSLYNQAQFQDWIQAERNEQAIYSITPGCDQLYGGFLMTFGGFFSENIRKNDYATGRKNGHEWLDKMASDNKLGPIHRPGIPFESDAFIIDPKLTVPTSADWCQFENAVQAAIPELLKQWRKLREVESNFLGKCLPKKGELFART
jgi:hypothetical protein